MNGNTARLRIGDFEFESQTGKLFRDGQLVKIEPQPLRVLQLLIERRGEIVRRAELHHHIWNGATFVEFDGGLNYCIRQIRRTLGDNAANPTYIETLPKQGYRFIADVAEAPQDAAKNPTAFKAIVPGTTNSAPAAWPRATWHTRLALTSGAITAGFVLLFFLLRPNGRLEPKPKRFNHNDSLQVRSIVAITNDPGVAHDPAVSPDGTQLAFSWNGEDGIDHVYIKSLGQQQRLSLSHGKYADRYPVWSPDGREIAFIRFRSSEDAEVVTISVRGGKEKLIRKVRLEPTVQANGRMLAWTVNPQWLCFVDQTPSGSHHLFLLAPNTGVVKPLQPRNSNWDESSPAFSLDGHLVAFVRLYGPRNAQIVIQKLDSSQQATGQSVTISDPTLNPTSPIWLEDGRLIFLDGGNLMQAWFGNPSVQQLYVTDSVLEGLSYDPVHSRLITSKRLTNRNIWTLPLRGAAAGNAKRLIRSAAHDKHPAFSPDGKWLAFGSDRSGAGELWLADSEGRNPRQLTQLSAYIIGYPHWSPDSKFIVFHARVPKIPELYLFRVEDNSLRKLTDEEPGFVQPSFSSDEKSVYCVQPNNGTPMLYKVNIEQGTREPLWYGASPAEAPGRNTLLYTKYGHPGIYARSLIGKPTQNPEIRLISDMVRVDRSFDPTSDGIFYSSTSSRQEILNFYSFATRQSSDIAPISTDFYTALSVKPDRTSVAYDGNADADSQLIEIKLK